MKKAMSLLMSTLLALAVAVPAFAADDNNNGMGTKSTGNNGITRGNGLDLDNNIDMDRGTGTFGTTRSNNAGLGDADYNGPMGNTGIGTNNTTRNFGTDDDNNFRTTAVGDDATDWGWLGLLGLIGLAGLFNRNRETTR